MKNHSALILEGIDGSGKSTIVKLLQKEFKNKFYIWNEPCKKKCIIGEFIREKILFKNNKISKVSNFFLFNACRLEHLNYLHKINKEQIILFDRSFISMLAYNSQKYFLNKISNIIKKLFLNKINIKIIFWLKITATTSLNRKTDIYTFTELQNIIQNYSLIFDQDIKLKKIPIIEINAEKKIYQVYEEIRNHIIKIL